MLEDLGSSSKPRILVVGEPESIVAQLCNTHDVHLVGQHSTYGTGVLAKVSSFMDATATSWTLPAAFPDVWVDAYAKLALRAVVATTERWLPLGTALASALKLPGGTPLATLPFFYDKAAMRRRLAALGAGWPSWSADELRTHRETEFGVHKGPFVVKPVDGTGSRGVCVVDSLPAALRVAEPGDFVELFIPGPEYSVDVFLHGGKASVLGVALKGTSFPGSFVESSHFVGSHLPFATQDLVAELERILSAVGYVDGPAHVEFKQYEGRFVFIEFHPRPGGDNIPRLCELAGGGSLLGQYLPLLGLAVAPTPVPTRPKGWSYIQYFREHPEHLARLGLGSIPLPCASDVFSLRAPRPDGVFGQSSERTASIVLWGEDLRLFQESVAELRRHGLNMDEVSW